MSAATELSTHRSALEACRSELAQAISTRRTQLQHDIAEHIEAVADLIEQSGLTAEELDMKSTPTELRAEAADMRRALR